MQQAARAADATAFMLMDAEARRPVGRVWATGPRTEDYVIGRFG